MEQKLLSPQKDATNQRVLDILFESDDVTWKAIIFGLIQENQMDPWDVDISIIARKFLDTLKNLKSLDFRISGKIVLASAVLLKLKSDKLMDEEIAALENLISNAEDPLEMDFFDEFPIDYPENGLAGTKKQKLVPRTPQPRKRKVSMYDLVEALEQALSIEAKRPPHKRAMYKEVTIPENHVGITEVIKEVYGRINAHYADTQRPLTFTEILPSEDKQDKVLTFIPLLHLDNQRKIDLLQEDHFGEISIDLLQEDLRPEDLGATPAKS